VGKITLPRRSGYHRSDRDFANADNIEVPNSVVKSSNAMRRTARGARDSRTLRRAPNNLEADRQPCPFDARPDVAD